MLYWSSYSSPDTNPGMVIKIMTFFFDFQRYEGKCPKLRILMEHPYLTAPVTDWCLTGLSLVGEKLNGLGVFFYRGQPGGKSAIDRAPG